MYLTVKFRLHCEKPLKFKKISVKMKLQVKMSGIYKQEKKRLHMVCNHQLDPVLLEFTQINCMAG